MPVAQSRPLVGLQFPYLECGWPEMRFQAHQALHVGLIVQLCPNGQQSDLSGPSGIGSVQTAEPRLRLVLGQCIQRTRLQSGFSHDPRGQIIAGRSLC